MSSENNSSVNDMFTHWRAASQKLSTTDIVTPPTSPSVFSSTSFAGILEHGLQDTLNSESSDMHAVMISDVKNYTAIFTIMGKQIAAVDDLIGTKDTD